MANDDWKLPWAGGCRCDRVRFRVIAAPLLGFACHCTGCQRMTASAYSLNLAIPSAGFDLVAGEPLIGGLHGPTRHHHCGHCKAWLYTRPEGNDAMINVRVSALDDHTWFVPWVEVFTGEGYPWAKTGARHSFVDNPADVPWEPMIEEYARLGARP